MRLSLFALLLVGCSPYVQSRVDIGYAECDTLFRCIDEGDIEDNYINPANYDSILECRERVDLSARMAYHYEEQIACYEEHCNYDPGNAADCVSEILDQDCGDLDDDGWSEDVGEKCSDAEIYDCPDEGGDAEDFAHCMEDAAENES